MTPDPVLVGGADRSGTTLMYALLASHPALAMVRRTNLWRWFDGRYGDLADPANLDRCLDDLVRYRRLEALQPDPERLRRELLAGPPTYGRLFDLLMRHHAERCGAPRWGDKSLHTEHHVDRVFAAFPDARVIHMLRDPRDRWASVRNRPDSDAHQIGSSTGRWVQSARAAARNQRARPDHYLVVRYEDLAADPEGTMRRVCAFIGEDYVPAMLQMGGVPSHREGSNSSFGDVGAGTISTAAVGRYRQVLDPHEVAVIQSLAGRHLTAAGYTPDPVPLPASERLQLAVQVLPVQWARMTAWEALTWRARRRHEPVVPAARLRDATPGEAPGHTMGVHDDD